MTQPAAVTRHNIGPWSAVSTANMAALAHRFAKFVAAPAGAEDRLGFALCGVADEPDGISYEGPASGQPGRIETIGRLEIELGGTVAAFDEVGPDSVGRGVVYPPGTGFMKVLKAGGTGNTVDGVWLGRRLQGAGFATFVDAGTLSRHTRYDTAAIPAGAAIATLPSGKYAGQPKTIRFTTDAGGSFRVDGAYLDLDGTARTTATAQDAGDILDVVWTGAAWQLLRNLTVTMG